MFYRLKEVFSNNDTTSLKEGYRKKSAFRNTQKWFARSQRQTQYHQSQQDLSVFVRYFFLYSSVLGFAQLDSDKYCFHCLVLTEQYSKLSTIISTFSCRQAPTAIPIKIERKKNYY